MSLANHATLVPFLATVLLAGCATRPNLHPGIVRDAALVPADGFVELGLDRSGRVLEMEIHTTAEHLPPLVREAMEKVVPGGTIVSCEKEYRGKKILWEVEKRVGGLKREVLFTSSGKLVATEFELAIEDSPALILSAADRWIRGGQITSVEEVREDGRLTYHVKKTVEGIRYKLAFTPGGELIVAVRELRAEIEVPLGR